MMKDENNPQALEDDPVPVITRKHFEEGVFLARKSVANQDLEKFEMFRRKFDPAYAHKIGGSSKYDKLDWPDDKSSKMQPSSKNKIIEDEDDDLYKS